MLILLGIGFLLLWGLGWLVFEVTSVAIHLLVIAAVVALGVHLFNRYRSRHGSSGADQPGTA